MKKTKTATQKANPQELAAYLFHQGTNFQAYEYLGAHREGDKFVFRVWAPNAKSVSVVGDFNQWEREANPMELIADGKIDTTPLITHTYPLQDIDAAYELFENRLDGVIKVAVKMGE